MSIPLSIFIFVFIIVIYLILYHIIRSNYVDINVYEMFSNLTDALSKYKEQTALDYLKAISSYNPTMKPTTITEKELEQNLITYNLSELEQLRKLQYATLKPATTITPMLPIAQQKWTNDLLTIQKENLQKEQLQLLKNLHDLKQTFDLLKKDIEYAKKEKQTLTTEINDINKTKEANAKVTKLLKDTMDVNASKEAQLKIQEAYLKELSETVNKKLEVINKPITLPPVSLNEEQMKLLLVQFQDLKKNFEELNKKQDDICIKTKEMPTPTENSFKDINDITYQWCNKCDKFKTDEKCRDFLSCYQNYLLNSDKKSLNEQESSTIYFKCINTYDKFPKYLNINNK